VFLITKEFFIQEELIKRFLELILDCDYFSIVYTFQAFRKVIAIHSSLLVLSCNCNTIFCIQFFNWL